MSSANKLEANPQVTNTKVGDQIFLFSGQA